MAKVNSGDLKLLYAFGRIFAPFYGLLMSLRAALYRWRILKSRRLAKPVISVGNLTMGGTGKTPMTIYLARLLAASAPAIISRGYGGKARGAINLVADHDEVYLTATDAGDEPRLMADSLPGVPVLTGAKRAVVGSYALDHLRPGLLILDDGFQHLALARDLDIVLFKVDTFLGNNRLFPGGDMREPLKALARAHCFVLTCVDDNNRQRAEAIKKALNGRFADTPVFMAEYRPMVLRDQAGARVEMDSWQDKPLLAFCGLAVPRLFRQSLEDTGFELAGFKEFSDHCPYTDRVVDDLIRKAAECGARALITTEKDMVKIRDRDLGLPVFALGMEVRAETDFDDFVLNSLSLPSVKQK